MIWHADSIHTYVWFFQYYFKKVFWDHQDLFENSFHCNIDNNSLQQVQRGKKWTITFTGSILGGAVPLSSEDHNLCINLCFISNSWKDRTGTNSISYQSPLLLLSWALSNSRYRHTNQKGFGITQGCLGERVSFLPSYHFWSQNDCAWERVKWLDKRSILKPKSFKWKVQNSLHPDSQQIIIKFLGATASPLFLGYVYEPLLISDLSPGLRVLKKKKRKKHQRKVYLRLKTLRR